MSADISSRILKKPFQFLDLSPELQRAVRKHLNIDELKNLSETSFIVYDDLQAEIFTLTTLRIGSRKHQHEQDLQHFINGRARLRTVSSAKYVRTLHLHFGRDITGKKASYIPGTSLDAARVGHIGIQALPEILGHITNETLPQLENLIIQVDRIADLWNAYDYSAHWYIVKPLLELKQVTGLRSIEIRTPDAGHVNEIRAYSAKLAESDLSQADLRCVKDKLHRAHQLRYSKFVGQIFGSTPEAMSGLFTYNLTSGRQKARHEHSDKCKYLASDDPQNLEHWRGIYCPKDWAFEKVETEGIDERLVGLQFAKVHTRMLHKATGRWAGLCAHIDTLYEDRRKEISAEKGHNLRKRKPDGYYLYLVDGGYPRQKRTKK